MYFASQWSLFLSNISVIRTLNQIKLQHSHDSSTLPTLSPLPIPTPRPTFSPMWSFPRSRSTAIIWLGPLAARRWLLRSWPTPCRLLLIFFTAMPRRRWQSGRVSTFTRSWSMFRSMRRRFRCTIIIVSPPPSVLRLLISGSRSRIWTRIRARARRSHKFRAWWSRCYIVRLDTEDLDVAFQRRLWRCWWFGGLHQFITDRGKQRQRRRRLRQTQYRDMGHVGRAHCVTGITESGRFTIPFRRRWHWCGACIWNGLHKNRWNMAIGGLGFMIKLKAWCRVGKWIEISLSLHL